MKSLVFFALIIGLDLFLKSVKDKKKIQEIRQKKMQEFKNIGNTKTVKQTETIIKREVQKNSSTSRSSEQDDFFEKDNSLDNQDYEERYENRYKDIEKRYEDIRESYKDIKSDSQSQSLYDPNAIQQRSKNQYDEADVRNYGRSDETIDTLVPKVSTFKKDILNGIIFSEILGKPKSLQNK